MMGTPRGREWCRGICTRGVSLAALPTPPPPEGAGHTVNKWVREATQIINVIMPSLTKHHTRCKFQNFLCIGGKEDKCGWRGEFEGPPPCAQNKNLYGTLSRVVFLCFYSCHVYALCTGLSLLVVIILTLSLCFFFCSSAAKSYTSTLLTLSNFSINVQD